MKYLWVLLAVLFINCSSSSSVYKVQHYDELVEDQELNTDEQEWIRLGVNEHDAGNFDEAIGYYKKVLANKPHSSMALHELTLTYNTVGNILSALHQQWHIHLENYINRGSNEARIAGRWRSSVA